MSIPFIISYILLWTVVILLTAALFILYSHVGERLILTSREGHALQGPELSRRIEPHVLTGLSGLRITLGAPSLKPTLMIYSSVSCQPCRQLLRALPELVARFGSRVDTVLVCRGEVSDVRAFTEGLPKEIVVCADARGDFVKPYRILITPYALSLDRDGTLRYKGVPGADLASLLHFVTPLIREEKLEQSHPQFGTPEPVAQF